MGERATSRPGTSESLIKDKDELIRIVEALQHDNLLIYAAEEN